MLTIALLTLSFTLAWSCVQQDSSASGISPDEYDVYSDLLDSVYIGRYEDLSWLPGYVELDSSEINNCWPLSLVTHVVIHDSTIPIVGRWPFDPLWRQQNAFVLGPSTEWIDWDGLSPSMASVRYDAMVIDPSKLSVKATVSTSPSSFERGWKGFYHDFPGSYGVARFSRVGFNPQRTQAVLYWEHSAARLVGIGEYWFLQRERDGWVPRWSLKVWVS